MLTDEFLSLQAVYFRLLGFDILKADGNCGKPYLRRTICSIFSVITFLPLTIAFGLHNIHNLDKLTDSLCSVLVDLLALYKIGLIIYLYKDFQQLIERFRHVLERECLQKDYAEIVTRENQRDQLISRLYKNCFLLAGLLACLMPLLGMFSSYWQTGHIESRILPFPSMYPWNNGHLLFYLVAYLWNIAAALGVILPTVCVDTLFCSLTHNLCALLKIVSYKMLHLEDNHFRESVEELAHIFHLYQESLSLGYALNSYFRPLICTEFLAASLHLCVLCLQLSNNLMQPGMLFYGAFIISILVQVSIYCYCGERVKTESRSFAWAIYASNWPGVYNPGIGRSLQISMMRSQRGIHIDGYFFEANLATLILIVQKAGSYITLLRSVT
ncbi:putative odorant receptor 98b [Drosophila willistoni]|uniref:putative odorant receptor 98b n=1 Tax=Drosophila willistoni TaxID=7260 RepID=UPI00017D8A4F|nr:putative odorant receptor 98b [Drosophila willistoni]